LIPAQLFFAIQGDQCLLIPVLELFHYIRLAAGSNDSIAASAHGRKYDNICFCNGYGGGGKLLALCPIIKILAAHLAAHPFCFDARRPKKTQLPMNASTSAIRYGFIANASRTVV
jgi:hypothetical protein